MSVLLFMAPWWAAPIVGFGAYALGRYIGAYVMDRIR